MGGFPDRRSGTSDDIRQKPIHLARASIPVQAGDPDLCYFFGLMKTLLLFILLASFSVSVLSGCKNGPSPEQQVRDLDAEKAAEKQQADFAKSLPPVQNPGKGQ